MKKFLMAIAVFVMILAMALPAMACEVGLDGSTYDQEETYYLEGSTYEDDSENGLKGFTYEEDDYSGLYNDPDMSAYENDGEVEFIPTGEEYYNLEYADSYISYEKQLETVYEKGRNIEGTGWDEAIIIESIPPIEYGGDPDIQRRLYTEESGIVGW